MRYSQFLCFLCSELFYQGSDAGALSSWRPSVELHLIVRPKRDFLLTSKNVGVVVAIATADRAGSMTGCFFWVLPLGILSSSREVWISARLMTN